MSSTAWRRVLLVTAAALALLASAVAPASPVAAAGPRPAKGPDPGAEVTPVGGETGADPRPSGERVAVQGTVTTGVTVRDASAGENMTCAIRADGTIGCWGWFVDWDTEDFAQVPAPPGTFKALSVGATLACAIGDDDSLTCWGMDTAGQLDVPSGPFSAVTAGDRHACAMRGDGTLACWGANDNFQATPPAGAFIGVDAGDGFTCAVREDGTLACWGYNGNNQSTPPSGTFKAVSAGSAHACAIRDNDDTVACWGYNGSNRSIPPQGPFTGVSAGGEHTCGLRDTGLVECWGDNDAGQTTEPAGIHLSVTAGGYHACAKRDDARLACWGSDDWGQVVPTPTARMGALPVWTSDTAIAVTWGGEPALAPIASFDVRYVATPWNAVSSTTTTWKSATAATSATLDATPGTSYCFSTRARDTEGRLSDWTEPSCAVVPLDDRSLSRSGTWALGSDPGAYASTLVQSTTPGATLTRSGLRTGRIALLATMCPTCGTVQLSWSGSTTPFRTVSLAAPVTVQRRFLPVLEDYSEASRTLVIKVVTSGRPVIIDGLLTTLTYETPGWVNGGNPPIPAASTSPRTVSALAASFDGSCAVRSDHSVACWGNNDDGKGVPPAGEYVAVAQGDYHTCVIATDGTLACWGYDEDGELTPPDGGPYTAIAAGAGDTCAIRDSGQVDCWGWGASSGEWSAPQGAFTEIAATRWGFCGLTTEGGLECWGNDYEYGDLTHPEGTFKAVAGRCAIRPDDTVTCWGDGQLGQDDPPDGTFKALATGVLHTCGIRTDDTLACWGDDNYLEASPPAGTFKAVVAGWAHACAIAMDDTPACWGHDGSSQVVPRPIAGVKRLGSWATTPTVSLAWGATGLAPIATYDVRYRKAAWNGPFGSAVALRTGTTAMAASLPGTAGATYCVSARATDADGHASAWTAETCTGFPLDDRSLARAGSWTRGTGSAYYRSTYVRSTSNGATLTRTGVSTRRISLVATTCATCGKVNVYWGTKLLKTIDLRSSTTVNRKVFSVATFSSVRTGTLKIKVITSGKKVIIDGVGLRRD